MLASNIFNGYIGSHLCYHIEREGIFDLFKNTSSFKKEHINENSFCKSRIENIELIIDYAIKFGILFEKDDGKIHLTKLGEDVKRNIGFFTWAVGGYGHFLRDFTDIKEGDRNAVYSLIDGANVALGSRQANKEFMWNSITEVISKLSINNIADLGCGGAGALIDICKKFKNISGIGIDISYKAIESATENIKKNGLQEKIEVVNQNVLDAIDSPILIEKFSKVDTVISFMMMHDLFNMKKPTDILRKLRVTFPNARTFIIADTFMSEESSIEHSTPIFSYGFEYVHHFMKIKLFYKNEYIEYFKQAGFEVQESHYLNVPNTYLFVLAAGE